MSLRHPVVQSDSQKCSWSVIYIYICIKIYTCIQQWHARQFLRHKHITRTQLYMYVYIYIYRYTQICTYEHYAGVARTTISEKQTHWSQLCMYIDTYICIHTYIDMSMHIQELQERKIRDTNKLISAMHIYVYIYTHIYRYEYTYTGVARTTIFETQILWSQLCICMYMHTHIYTYEYTYTGVAWTTIFETQTNWSQLCIYMYMYTRQYIFEYIYAGVVRTTIFETQTNKLISDMRVYVYVYTHTYIWIDIYIHMNIHIYIYRSCTNDNIRDTNKQGNLGDWVVQSGGPPPYQIPWQQVFVCVWIFEKQKNKKIKNTSRLPRGSKWLTFPMRGGYD